MSVLKDMRVLGVGRYLYLRFLYRHHAKLLHRVGLHNWKDIGPVMPTGEEWELCTWCGAHKP